MRALTLLCAMAAVTTAAAALRGTAAADKQWGGDGSFNPGAGGAPFLPRVNE